MDCHKDGPETYKDDVDAGSLNRLMEQVQPQRTERIVCVFRGWNFDGRTSQAVLKKRERG